MQRPYNWYRDRGFLEAAKQDESVDVRVKAYESLGWTMEALGDSSSRVRCTAYNRMGWMKSALTDPDPHIQRQAESQQRHDGRPLPDGPRPRKYDKVTLENAPKYLVGKDEMLRDYAALLLKRGG